MLKVSCESVDAWTRLIMGCHTLSKVLGHRHKKCIEVFFHFHFELNILRLLSVPTDKNLKDGGQHIVRLYLKNYGFAHVY